MPSSTSLRSISATRASIDIRRANKIGASCTLCHAINDAPVFNLAGSGSIRRAEWPCRLRFYLSDEAQRDDVVGFLRGSSATGR